MDRAQLTAEISGLVNDLNDKGSATAIAAHLAEHDIKGKRGNACSCPVAEYLTRFTPDDVPIVSVGRVEIVSPGDDACSFVPTPENVRTFITQFDAGLFPGLDLEPIGT